GGGRGRARGAFGRRGGWMVAVSRWLPVLPEAVACLAGLAGMQWRRFVLALTCGSLPVGFAFAAIGHLGQAQPGWAVALSALVPVVLWWAARRWV
ncbi:MAG: VTT domain-containing protein, partial [Verrucomicrobiales bacterium]|nr:VTT domain-containing protein [Verrucomicrobiales bacterium]